MELQKKELERAQADVLLSQIQPHFLYNSLTAIRYLCESDPHEAKQAISDFSLFLRANMNSLKSKAPIPLEQELKHVELYLNLEKRRFGDRISVQFEILESEFLIPPLTLQPLVENAVHHGILKKQEGGTIIIRSEEKAGTYVIVVSDDGSGFSESTIRRGGIEKEGSHIGIENVRGRLAAMANGVLEIQSREGVGTHIMITIPKGKKTQEDNHEISFGRR